MGGAGAVEDEAAPRPRRSEVVEVSGRTGSFTWSNSRSSSLSLSLKIDIINRTLSHKSFYIVYSAISSTGFGLISLHQDAQNIKHVTCVRIHIC